MKIITLWLLLGVVSLLNADSGNITHHDQQPALRQIVDSISDKIIQRGDLPHITVVEQLDILEELATFPLGAFLIQNRGLNGLWTDYYINHPTRGKITGLNSEGKPLGKVEKYLLESTITFTASRERFVIFKKELQDRCQEGVVLASAPCGVMGDLLQLDFRGLTEFHLIGSDIDPQSIKEADRRANELGLGDHASFYTCSAWNMPLDSVADVLTSNGLNFYEANDDKVVDLYRAFLRALKPGGVLVTSFLTPPIGFPQSEWLPEEVDMDNFLMEKIIYSDIIGASWRTYRTTEQTKAQLEAAGFVNVRFINDRAHVFPTVIAERP
ncbi:MAG: class I SAM-dependent methyltransferase [Chlamydiales bacterium]|nr:class I SAM-dependent methyltransferase [Chlamydiales bacterium]